MEAPLLVGPDQPLLDGFMIRLPYPMARRVEDGALVFWHSPNGLTFWISAGERRDPDSDPVQGWQGVRSDAATDEKIEREGSLVRFGYRLAEESDDEREPAFYGYIADGTTEFMLAAYFNKPETIGDVLDTWRSTRRTD